MWQLRRFAPAIDGMGDGEERMAPQHPGAGVAHHLADALAHFGVVAVHLAARAGRLLLAEHATVEAPRRVIHQRRAFVAQPRRRRVPVAAVDAHHGADRRQLTRQAREAAAIVGASRRCPSRNGRAAGSVHGYEACHIRRRAAMTCVKRGRVPLRRAGRAASCRPHGTERCFLTLRTRRAVDRKRVVLEGSFPRTHALTSVAPSRNAA